jgi:hypothetical protein
MHQTAQHAGYHGNVVTINETDADEHTRHLACRFGCSEFLWCSSKGMLYYGWAVDLTILKALNLLTHQQSKPTTTTLANTSILLDSLASHPDAVIQY